VSTISLVDTGADVCAFPFHIGIALGLFEKNEQPTGFVTGAGGSDIEVIHREVSLEVCGIGMWMVTAAFSIELDRQQIGGLLGGDGFFDRNLVRFDMASEMFFVSLLPPSTHGDG